MSYIDSREEKEITLQDAKGEVKFVLKQYDAFKGLAYQRKLLKILAPCFLVLQEQAKQKNEDFMGLVIKSFIDNIDEVEPAFLKELVLQGAYKEGRVTINFENDFAGRYAVLFMLIKELIVFNFEDLFQFLGSN